jgi:uncharacterized protein (DUF2252 family)
VVETHVVRLTIAERMERGRAARKLVPRSSHAEWSPGAGRKDPVASVTAQDRDRLDFLVPVRHERMSVSPFTFYRATAELMANDLALSPHTAIQTQLCGDAHVGNFGGFASPERELLFDLNDFDETLPGPFEWDVKRLAASMVLACRHAGVSPSRTREIAGETVLRYQQATAKLAKKSTLDVWYDRVAVREVAALITEQDRREQLEKTAEKARKRNSLRSFAKLAETVDGTIRLRSDPPLLIPVRDLADLDPGDIWRDVVEVYTRYTESVRDDLKVLLDRYELVDAALKVVGVGSVGTLCFVALLIGRNEGDPLLLQVKEAGPSALEGALGKSAYPNAGRRVVEGQRLLQSFGDIFLGWADGLRAGRAYYTRQLKDMKVSVPLDEVDEISLDRVGQVCGATLARAHARAGDPIETAAYLGKSDTFARAVTRFAELYADQAERDYEEFRASVPT